MQNGEEYSTRILEAFFKLHLEDGDVVFVDPHVIDLDVLDKIPDPFKRSVTFVCVQPLIGRSMKDSVCKISRKDLEKLINPGAVTGA